ncbi:MAG: hypothetical protein K2O16_07630 [Lachnospiraceae bacterium]|nr:hypothetical protein [Lachnospiraceae bacterium]
MGGLSSAAFYGAGRAAEAVNSSVRNGYEAGSNSKVDNTTKQAKEWLGKDVRTITNKNGDKVFMSNDATKRLKFDINNTSPHNNPHGHVEEFVDGKWIKSGPIYPADVPHN